MVPYPIQSSSILQSYPFNSNLVLSYLIPSCPFQSSNPIQILSHHHFLFYPILSYSIQPHSILSYTNLYHPIPSYPIHPLLSQSQPISSLSIVFFFILSHSLLYYPILSLLQSILSLLQPSQAILIHPFPSCLFLYHPILYHTVQSYHIETFPSRSITSYPVQYHPILTLSLPIPTNPIPSCPIPLHLISFCSIKSHQTLSISFHFIPSHLFPS